MQSLQLLKPIHECEFEAHSVKFFKQSIIIQKIDRFCKTYKIHQ
jgi:hypothetical protein